MTTFRPPTNRPEDHTLARLLALVARITRESRQAGPAFVLIDAVDLAALGAAWRKYQTILSAAPEPGAEDES